MAMEAIDIRLRHIPYDVLILHKFIQTTKLNLVRYRWETRRPRDHPVRHFNTRGYSIRLWNHPSLKISHIVHRSGQDGSGLKVGYGVYPLPRADALKVGPSGDRWTSHPAGGR